jgi:hypothetical protein
MDIKSIAVAGLLGGIGVSPLSSGVGVLIGRGTARRFGHDLFHTINLQLFLTAPIVLGDECECGENQHNLKLGGFLEGIAGALH